MKIPSPAHTISQNNVKESEQENKKLDKGNDNPVETKPTDDTKEDDVAQSIKEPEEDEIKNKMESNVKEEPNDEDKTQ